MKLYTDGNIMDINFISIINWDYEIMKFYIDFKHYLMEKWNLIWSREIPTEQSMNTNVVGGKRIKLK